MSNQMNPWLAEIYGTDGADDLEKTAQAHLLQKLAAEQNLDISQFAPEELEQLIQELAAEGYDVGALMQPQQGQQQMAPQMGQPQQPQQGIPGQGMQPQMGQQGLPQQQQRFAPAPQQQGAGQGFAPQMMQQAPQADAAAMQKEAAAKFEEADLLGRVMAHAYTNELEKIASHRKTAGKLQAAKDAIKGAAGKAGAHIKANKGAYAAGAAGAGAGFAAGRMSKKASAFEKLAEEHAAEILSATGYDPATGQDMYGQQMLQQSMGQQQPQQAAAPQQQAQPQDTNSYLQQFIQQQAVPQQTQQPQQQQVDQGQQGQEQTESFGDALDSRALELLAQNGYDVNEILARIQMMQGQGQQGQA